jgi:hypothetical protein
MIRIENKVSGEIVETDTRNWRNALNIIKHFSNYEGSSINIKASDFINKVSKGYEDSILKANIIQGDWRN